MRKSRKSTSRCSLVVQPWSRTSAALHITHMIVSRTIEIQRLERVIRIKNARYVISCSFILSQLTSLRQQSKPPGKRSGTHSEISEAKRQCESPARQNDQDNQGSTLNSTNVVDMLPPSHSGPSGTENQEQTGLDCTTTPGRGRDMCTQTDSYQDLITEEIVEVSQDVIDGYFKAKRDIVDRRKSIERLTSALKSYKDEVTALKGQDEAIIAAAEAEKQELEAKDLEASQSFFAAMRNPTREQRIQCFEAATAREKEGMREIIRIQQKADEERGHLASLVDSVQAKAKDTEQKLDDARGQLSDAKQTRDALR